MVSPTLKMPRIYFFVFVFAKAAAPNVAALQKDFAAFKAALAPGQDGVVHILTGTIHLRDYAGTTFEVGVMNKFAPTGADLVSEMVNPKSNLVLAVFDLQTSMDCDPGLIQQHLDYLLANGCGNNLHYELCCVSIT